MCRGKFAKIDKIFAQRPVNLGLERPLLAALLLVDVLVAGGVARAQQELEHAEHLDARWLARLMKRLSHSQPVAFRVPMGKLPMG